MGLGWFDQTKLEDERSGKDVLRVGVGCLKAAKFLVPAELVVACGVVCKQGDVAVGS
jgi:hypothetical protein